MSPLPWRVIEETLEDAPHSPVGLSIIDADGNTVCDFYVHTGPCFEPHGNCAENAQKIVDMLNRQGS